jgi:PAS domain S-box-containing protein
MKCWSDGRFPILQHSNTPFLFFVAKLMTNSESKYNILIVDDVPENFQMISGILYQQKINISIAQSGKEALKAVVHRPPDLILLDIIMPEMDGFEVCKHIKKNPDTKDIPIIFLTVRTQADDIIKGFELGAVDYITKPFHSVELLSRVLTHLELKRSRDLLATENQQRKVLLESAIEALTHPFYVIDAHDYTVKIANSTSKVGDAIGRITCYALMHHCSAPCQDLECPCPLEEVKRRRKPVLVKYMHFDQEGHVRHVEVHGYPMFDEEGNVAQVIEYALDITERRLAEKAVQKSEQQYRFLVENVTDGIGVIQKGKLVFVNEALASMLGFTIEQLIGSILLDLVHENHKAEMKQMYEQLEKDGFGSQWQILQCIIRGDGRELWVEGRHSVIEWEGEPAVLVSIRDISHLKLRELEMEEERKHLQEENIQLKSTMKERYRFGEIVGKSPAMQEVYELILKAAGSDANVIIYGESGTGRELIAQTIHQISKRKGHAFIPVNCGAIPNDLFESEFFGHRKGSFTVAHRDKEDFFDLARGGSLFLDELEALSPGMQTKLPRAIEGGGYMPVGGNKIRKTDVRIIAATNRNLTEQVEQGFMRDDFFYRMYVIAITIPPLRDRREDIPLLIDHFLKQYGDGTPQPMLSGKVLNALYDHGWPGNVRELQNTIQRFLTTGRLDFIGIRKPEIFDSIDISNTPFEQKSLPLPEAVKTFEKRMITRMLNQNN